MAFLPVAAEQDGDDEAEEEEEEAADEEAAPAEEAAAAAEAEAEAEAEDGDEDEDEEGAEEGKKKKKAPPRMVFVTPANASKGVSQCGFKPNSTLLLKMQSTGLYPRPATEAADDVELSIQERDFN